MSKTAGRRSIFCFCAFPLALLFGACASAGNGVPESSASTVSPDPALDQATPSVGVLVMAHGGSDDWNRSVGEAVAPLASEVPTALAYGMADRITLEASMDSLRRRGVTHVAVVRAFLSGESFFDQTAFYLGLSDEPPARFMVHHAGAHGSGEDMTAPIAHGLTVATHMDGLLPSEEATEIMVDRALVHSESPPEESVILIAHGMGAEGENQRVLDAMIPIVGRLEDRGFARVHASTLREDWPEPRVVAEQEIRAFVRSETQAGRRVLVLPMRLQGFGPYADVLDGLEYVGGEGLVPHDLVGTWMRARAAAIVCGEGWGDALGPCPTVR